MNFISNRLHLKFQRNRFSFFMKYFSGKSGKLLDLGGADGSFLKGFRNELYNFDIYVADIDPKALLKAKINGFKTILLDETDKLPFASQEWDVVFCNSVIEHYTGPKKRIFSVTRSKEFIEIAQFYQKNLASEIRRIGKSYFVQTPHKYFPIESHTQFPFTGYLNRSMQVRLIKILNLFWIKKTQPDWSLLNMHTMKRLFPEAKIIIERWCGFPKSILAIKI